MSSVEDVLMVKGPDVVVAGPDCTVDEAARLMYQANVDSVIVRDHGAVVGIFTEGDMVGQIVAKGVDAKVAQLGEVMSSPVKSCGLGDSMESCIEKLSREHVRRLAVIADGVLLGVIGLQDVLHAQLKAQIERVEELETMLDERSMGVEG
ncbi:MAG: CBS domain-containing protein [Phycisphaerae bacterium]|jgi:CBS domain-containing protein|nr:CBS domain-containing protein [Phycisphaerae bacterium]MDP7286978.1 CBS domain-containing protein [Phycisphaerae bacterium]